MTAKYYLQDEVAQPVRAAFIQHDRMHGHGRAGRVVSGLLKAACKHDGVQVLRNGGRVTYSVRYLLTEQQLAEIRAKAISRAHL